MPQQKHTPEPGFQKVKAYLRNLKQLEDLSIGGLRQLKQVEDFIDAVERRNKPIEGVPDPEEFVKAAKELLEIAKISIKEINRFVCNSDPYHRCMPGCSCRNIIDQIGLIINRAEAAFGGGK